VLIIFFLPQSIIDSYPTLPEPTRCSPTMVSDRSSSGTPPWASPMPPSPPLTPSSFARSVVSKSSILYLITILQTSIIATIGMCDRRCLVRCWWSLGPNTNTVEKLAALRRAGVNVGQWWSHILFLRWLTHPSFQVRMNFSHGSYDYHQSVIDNTRKMVAGN
jgi:hypothetical protein